MEYWFGLLTVAVLLVTLWIVWILIQATKQLDTISQKLDTLINLEGKR